MSSVMTTVSSLYQGHRAQEKKNGNKKNRSLVSEILALSPPFAQGGGGELKKKKKKGRGGGGKAKAGPGTSRISSSAHLHCARPRPQLKKGVKKKKKRGEKREGRTVARIPRDADCRKNREKGERGGKGRSLRRVILPPTGYLSSFKRPESTDTEEKGPV